MGTLDSLGFARATITTAQRYRGGSLYPAGSGGPNGCQEAMIVVLPHHHRRKSLDTPLARLPVLLWLLFGCVLVDWQGEGHSVVAQDACRATCGGSSDTCAQGNFSACTVNCNGTSSSTSTSTTTMDNTCLGATFGDASVVTCNGDGVCDNAQFLDQTIANCVGDTSCHQATVWSSTLRCNGENSCSEAHVYAGTVSCAEYTTCESLAYKPCTCCQEDNTYSYCPLEMPKCSNSVLEFCASTYLGRTCAEWNNPVCAGLSIGE
jgi:hypothetical protein